MRTPVQVYEDHAMIRPHADRVMTISSGNDQWEASLECDGGSTGCEVPRAAFGETQEEAEAAAIAAARASAWREIDGRWLCPFCYWRICYWQAISLTAAFVTGGGNGPPTHTPAARPTQPRERTPRKQPARERARRALDELYSNGVHDQISKSNAELVSAVNAQIKKRGQQDVSRDTILRAAGRYA